MKVYKDTQFRLESWEKLSWGVGNWAETWDLKDEQEFSKERKLGWVEHVQSCLGWEKAYAEAIMRRPYTFHEPEGRLM